MASPESTRPAGLSGLGALLWLGWGIAVWITLGVLAGRWADTHWGWQPWGTLCGALFGISGAGFSLYRAVRRLDALDKSAREARAARDARDNP